VTESVQEEPALAAAILKAVIQLIMDCQRKYQAYIMLFLYLGFNNVYQLYTGKFYKKLS